MVSVDGTEWTNTGITLGEAGLSLISDVNVEDDYVEFILNGNAGSFQVKRVTELKCEFLSGKTIFEYEEMKNLSMDVSGYVKYDIDYPEGWTVEFDGTAEVTFGEPVVTYNSIELPFTRPENTWRVYATYMTEAEYTSDYESSDDAVKEFLLNSWPFNTDYPTTSDVYGNFNLSPNTKGYVFVVVIDNDGKIGPLQKKEVTTTDVPRDATIGFREPLVFQGR